MKGKTISVIFVLFVFTILIPCSSPAIAAQTVPINDEITEEIFEVITNNPDARIGEYFQHDNYSFSFLANREDLYVFYLSQVENYTTISKGVGVIDIANRQVIVSAKYEDIQFLPDGSLFGWLYEDSKGAGTYPENNLYYSIDKNGNETKMFLKSLPENCFITGVDERGYATFCTDTKEGYYRLGLLNIVSDTLVLSAIADSLWPGVINFQDEMTIIQTGTTIWTKENHHNADGNGKYGVIDREGNFIIPAEYDSLSYLGSGKFSAWIGSTETVLDTNSYTKTPSSWAIRCAGQVQVAGVMNGVGSNTFESIGLLMSVQLQTTRLFFGFEL